MINNQSLRKLIVPKDLMLYTSRDEKFVFDNFNQWNIFYFWASSCPCVARCQRNSLNSLIKKFDGHYIHGKRISFYAVASNRSNFKLDPLSKKTKFILQGEKGNFPICPIILDEKQIFADLIEATNTPQTFFISPKNEILFSGDPDDSSDVWNKTGKEIVTKYYLKDAMSRAFSGKQIVTSKIEASGCLIDRSK